MYYIGIDLGGTNIKGGIYDGEKVLIKNEIKTGSINAFKVLDNITLLINQMLHSLKLELTQVHAIGVGIPGMIDSKNGKVLYSNNLKWEDVDFIKELKSRLLFPVPV